MRERRGKGKITDSLELVHPRSPAPHVPVPRHPALPKSAYVHVKPCPCRRARTPKFATCTFVDMTTPVSANGRMAKFNVPPPPVIPGRAGGESPEPMTTRAPEERRCFILPAALSWVPGSPSAPRKDWRGVSGATEYVASTGRFVHQRATPSFRGERSESPESRTTWMPGEPRCLILPDALSWVPGSPSAPRNDGGCHPMRARPRSTGCDPRASTACSACRR